jgi:hypothetical protein
MFGGTGSGIAALKRNGIAMSKIIHVEHDMVANHVYMWNHDAPYTERLAAANDANSEIEHIYFELFEDIRDNLDNFLECHGREFPAIERHVNLLGN